MSESQPRPAQPSLEVTAAPAAVGQTRLGGFGRTVAAASMLYQTGLFYVVLLHDGVVHTQYSMHRPPEQFTRERVVPWALFTLSGLLPAMVSLYGHSLKRRWLQSTG